MRYTMRNELGVPAVVDRGTFQPELDALPIREKAHTREGDAIAAAHRAADWFCLAAAPTFAIMALLTSVLGGSQPDILCSAAEHTSPLSGMIPMYLLMSVFHSQPWLKVISNRHRCPELQSTQLPAP